MRSFFSRRLGLLLTVCLVSASAAQVSAQSERESSQYRELIKQGLREYDLGNFSEAKAFFSQAHDLYPNARTLRGLGMSSYELRHYVEAIDYFQQSLSSTERPLTPKMRSEVGRLLQQARGFVTRLRVKLDPPDAALHVDTRDPQTDEQGFVLIDAGNHQLVVQADGYESATRNVRTDGGEELSIEVSLRPIAETTAEAAHGEPAAPVETPAPATATAPVAPAETSNVGPYVLIGASGAVAIAGGVMLGIMAKNKSDVDNAPASDTTYWRDYQARADSVFPLSVAGFAAAGVGVAGLVGGIVWLVTKNGATERGHDSARLELTPTGARVAGRF